MNLSRDEFESFARMYHGWRNEMYGHEMACGKLALYGLTDAQISRIVKYAETHGDEWDARRRALEMAG